MMNKLIFT